MLLWLAVTMVNIVVASNQGDNLLHPCPSECECVQPHTLNCANAEIGKIPADWPADLRRLIVRNCTLSAIHKNAFKRFQKLEELKIVKCPNLDVIDKMAFKGLNKLSLIHISDNPKLSDIFKSTFSGIGNQHGLRIYIHDNGLRRIHGHSFRNAHNIRELSIIDSSFEVMSHAFSSIFKLDFLTLKGVNKIDSMALANTSRVHRLVVHQSKLSISPMAFSKLTHVNQWSPSPGTVVCQTDRVRQLSANGEPFMSLNPRQSRLYLRSVT
uniref:LRRNT domain-containing protein n=1 Tax=Steinernema glaseri TaxID=37863 RepID=A0A1I8A7K6_9BILA